MMYFLKRLELQAQTTEPPLLQPLVFENPADPSDNEAGKDDQVECMMCEKCFQIKTENDTLLRHLLHEHKLVIGEVKMIADLPGYFCYWKKRLKEETNDQFFVVIQTNSAPTDTGPKEFYSLLCDALPEDKQLRMKLQKEKLEEVLNQQQRERSETTSRSCLFCKEHFEEQRADIFDHMMREHGFNIGHPDNLVYAEELLDILQNNLDSLKCLYCEKTFKDRHILKEHMRKKLHKKINPKNTVYDKFYLVNYLELGKNWEAIQSEDDRDIEDKAISHDSDANQEWEDWAEVSGAPDVVQVVCLFCQHAAASTNSVIQHMKDSHAFDIFTLTTSLGLGFYQQVKVINYIRRQVHQNSCHVCHSKFKSRSELLIHLEGSQHIREIPETTSWDQPQYYFPTYENDSLLCILGESEEGGAGAPPDKVTECNLDTKGVVIAEDVPSHLLSSILHQESLREQLL